MHITALLHLQLQKILNTKWLMSILKASPFNKWIISLFIDSELPLSVPKHEETSHDETQLVLVDVLCWWKENQNVIQKKWTVVVAIIKSRKHFLFYVEHVTLYQKVYIKTCINVFLLLVIGGHKSRSTLSLWLWWLVYEFSFPRMRPSEYWGASYSTNELSLDLLTDQFPW